MIPKSPLFNSIVLAKVASKLAAQARRSFNTHTEKRFLEEFSNSASPFAPAYWNFQFAGTYQRTSKARSSDS